MNKKKIICPCKNLTKGDILDAVKKGAKTYKDVKCATGAGSECKKCKKKIQKLVKKQVEKD